MFTVQQTVANAGTAPVQVATYALVNRKGGSVDPDSWTIHIGPMAVHGGSADYDINFKDIDEAPERFDTTGGWLGFSDKYWLTALIPDQRSEEHTSELQSLMRISYAVFCLKKKKQKNKQKDNNI